MSTCDILTTQALQGAMQGSCIPTKPLLAMEPKMRIELTTYALRVRYQKILVESGRDTSVTATGFAHFLGTRWSHMEASELATEVTTLSDIHRSAEGTRLLSLLIVTQPHNGLVIYTAPVPYFFGTFSISCAAAAPACVIILSDIWTNTLASLFGLPQQSSARWTCWREFETGPVARWYVRRLSSTLQHDSDLLKPKMPLDVDEYLLGGFLNPCW